MSLSWTYDGASAAFGAILQGECEYQLTVRLVRGEEPFFAWLVTAGGATEAEGAEYGLGMAKLRAENEALRLDEQLSRAMSPSHDYMELHYDPRAINSDRL
jgi:hypothetical protein